MRDRLIKLLDTNCGFCDEQKAETLADYLLANGVIIPPCKVGDKVYQLDECGDIYESEIINIIYDTSGIAFDETAIGKNIFLTKEELGRKVEKRGKE